MRALAILFLCCTSAICGPKSPEVSAGVQETRDVPLQRSIYRPSKIFSVKAKDAWHGTVDFRVYPYLTKSFDGKQKSLGLVIDTSGRADVGACWMVIMADGSELFKGNILGQHSRGLLDNRSWRFDASSQEFPQFESVVRGISKSTETWLTIGCSSNIPDRRSVRLTDDQIGTFKNMVAFADSR